MLAIGSFVRVTCDTLSDEPLVEGMVGRVVADLFGRIDPSAQALVVIGGARKPCAVPLEAVEVISEADYGDELLESRSLWKQRRGLWRQRHEGPLPKPGEEPREAPALRLSVRELLARAQAVTQSELAALASAPLVSLLTEWSTQSLEVLAEELPRFRKLSYGRVQRLRAVHLERWLWSGARLYVAVRSFHAGLSPATAEPAAERVRALFSRIDGGEASARLAAFCLDVEAVKDALTLSTSRCLESAIADLAPGLAQHERAFEQLAQVVLQLHIVGFQAAFCADALHHGAPAH